MFSESFLEQIYSDKSIQDIPIEHEIVVIHAIERIIENLSLSGCCMKDLCEGSECERCKNVQ